MKKAFYIAEINLPSTSAYSTHVLKMCNHLSQKFKKTELLLISKSPDISYQSLEKKYLLRYKKKFFIKSFFKTRDEISFLGRIWFALKIANYIKNETNPFVISRSLMSSFFLSIFKVYHFLEIHHELRGLTKFIFVNLNFLNSKYINKVVFISKTLSKLFNTKNFIILHDAVDLGNFTKANYPKYIKNIGYVGSFYTGRGIENIIRMAKMNTNLNFHLVGKKKNSKFDKLDSKNIRIYDHVSYSKIPNILSKMDVLLMPYEKTVRVNSENLNTAKYCSPLKMFDYLASKKIIISSNLSGISEILKDQYNSFLAPINNVKKWNLILKKIANNKKLRGKICKNAYLTAKKHTWKKRVDVFLKYYSNQNKRFNQN